MNLCKITTLIGGAALLAASLTLHAAEDHPVYRPETRQLFIPSIDTAEMQGAYHNAVLEFVQADLWRLKDISQGVDVRGIRQVRVIQTDSFPTQVFLELQGWATICGQLDIGQRRVGHTFEISVQEVNSRKMPILCAQVISFFSWIVPLQVYGLDAGEYQYVVNGGVSADEYLDGGGSVKTSSGLSGSFVLEKHNRLESAGLPNLPFEVLPGTTALQLSPSP